MLQKLVPKDVLVLLGLMWGVYLLDVLLIGINLNLFGIQPRMIDGLAGLFFSPFLHGGLFHLLSNSIALIGTAILVRMAIGSQKLRWIMFWCAMGAGIGTWSFAQAGLVVGASGLVYGLIGFLFGYAYFHPSLKTWAIALVSFFLFGGAVLAMFKFSPFISWAAHFWGFISGLAGAYAITKIKPVEDKYSLSP